MKTVALIALLLTAAGTFAADLYNPKLSVDAGVYTTTTNFEDEQGGVLIGLNARFTEHIGVNLTARAHDDRQDYIDRTDLNLTFRAAFSETGAITPYVGAHRNWEYSDSGAQAGLRVDQKIYGPLGLFVGAEWGKDFNRDSDHGATGYAGLSFAF